MVDEGPGGGLAEHTVVDDHTYGHGGWLSATVTHTEMGVDWLYGMATIATSTPLLPHTHTTVTVIGGTAKQLLGSSTDWCATIIVTPHTRVVPLLHTHTHGWESGVVWSMCCECCVHQHLDGHFTLPHTLCV